MSSTGLERMLGPKSLALIGASDQDDSLGTAFTRQVLDSDFAGAVHLVNRQRSEVFGRRTVDDAGELPEGVDLALVLTPWDSVPGVIDQLARRRCGGAVIVGIASEQGWPWASKASQLKRLQRRLGKSDLRIIGPASQGLTLARIGLNLSLCPALPPAGGIGFVASAGAVAGVIADWAARRGVGMSAVISLGDQIDIDVADCLDWFANDANTRAVLMHVDGIAPARKLLSAARALSFRKPLVALMPRAGSRESAPGDARLSDQVHAAALRRAGVLQARNLEELCAATNVDLPAWPHAGSRFAIVGNGSALGALAADAIADAGGSLAAPVADTQRRLRALLPPRSAIGNPLDLQRDAGPKRYCDAVAALASDPGTDVLLVLHHPTSFVQGSEIAAALEPVHSGEALVLAAFAGAEQQQARRILAERGIAAFPTPEAAVRAYGLNRRYFSQKAELMQTPPPLLRWPLLDRNALERRLADPAKDPALLLRALLGDIGIDLRWDTSRRGSEPALAFRVHPMLGPYVHAWDGQHSHLELLPLDRLRVERLLQQGWGAQTHNQDLRATLQGHLLLLAELVGAVPALSRLELHGIGANSQGEVLAHVELDWDESAARCPTAFAPYPVEIAETIELRDGERLLLRPIRAEDEPALQIGFTQLSPEEVRMRFLYPLKSMTHDLSARLSQIDYDRELALVLADFEPPGQARLYAVVRASFDLRQRAAEFAIVIPAQFSGQGLGTRLLQRLIDLCRAAGMRSIYGDTLLENIGMRALARKLGFVERLSDKLIRIERPL